MAAKTPTGITLGAYLQNPALLDQTAELQKQQLLAKALAAAGQQQITNPNPTGAFLQGLTGSAAPFLGAYLAGKTLDTEAEQQKQALATKSALLQAAFSGGGTESGGGGISKTALPYYAAALAGDTGALTEYLKTLAPTDQQKLERGYGIAPEQGRDLYLAHGLKEGTLTASPGQVLMRPGAAPLAIGDPEKGTQLQFGPNDEQSVVALPGAADVAAQREYKTGVAQGAARLQTTITPGYDPATGQFRNQTQAQSVGQGGLPSAPSPAEVAGLGVRADLAKEQGRGELARSGEQIKGWQTEAENGYAMRQLIKPQQAQLQEAIKSGQYGPGALAGFQGSVGKWMQAVGFGEGWDLVQQSIFNRTFDQKTKMAAMASLGGKLGVGVSNADVEFIMDNMPRANDSPQAAAAILQTLDRLAATKQARYEQWNQAKQVNPGITPDQFNNAWGKRIQDHPDMTDRRSGKTYIWNVVTNKYEAL